MPEIPKTWESLKDMGPIAGAGAALLSTLITASIGWLKDRGEGAKRLSRIDDAAKRVAFVQAWSETRTRLDPNNSAETHTLALEQLDLIFGEFKSLAAQHAAVASNTATAKRQSVGWFRKALLLYKPPRWRAWVPRIFFYLMVVETVFYGISQRHDPDMQYFYLGAGIFLVLFWVISVVME